MSVLRKISPHLPGISVFSDWAQVSSSESVPSGICFLCCLTTAPLNVPRRVHRKTGTGREL